MATSNYTSEMLEWIRHNANTHWDAVANGFNKRFGCNKSPDALRTFALRHGIRCNAPVHNKFYSDIMLQWLQENVPNTPWNTLAKRFNKHFYTNRSARGIKEFCKRQRILNNIQIMGRNAHPNGTVRRGQNQNQIKINGRWRSNAVYVYEHTHNVKLDLRKYRVIHMNRDMFDDNPDNLYAFPIQNLCALSWHARRGTIFTREILDTLSTIAQIQQTRTRKINEIFGSRSAAKTARYHSDAAYREHVRTIGNKSKRKYREKLKQQGNNK